MALLSRLVEIFQIDDDAIRSFASGGAGGVIWGVADRHKRKYYEIIFAVISGAFASYYFAIPLADWCGVVDERARQSFGFMIGICIMAIVPNFLSFIGRLNFKVPKVFDNVVEDGKDD